MLLNTLLDQVIFEEVYTPVRIQQDFYYPTSTLPEEAIDRLESDRNFFICYKEELTRSLIELGYKDLVILSINLAAHTIELEYTAYYSGSRQYPEMHLKRLLVLNDNRGLDLRDTDIFDSIVVDAITDLEAPNLDMKEARTQHFAGLFKEAIAIYL